MIDSMDIYRAIKEALEKYVKSTKVRIKDIKNPDPPCFYIKPVTDNNYQTATDYMTTDYLYSVVYFSDKKTLENLLTVKKELKTIFTKPLKVTSFDNPEETDYLEIDSVDITIDEEDYFLTATLTIQVTQPLSTERYDSTNNELMENMELDIDSDR